MFTPQSFITCVTENLTARGFGQQRIAEITQQFDERVQAHVQDGRDIATAGSLAVQETFDNLTRIAQERAKRDAKNLAVQAENIRRIGEGAEVPTSRFTLDGGPAGQGTAIARAAVSLLEDDPRFSGLSYTSIKDTTRGQLYALFGASLEDFGRGIFGRQKGKAHLPNVVREIQGEATGDGKAKAMADAWLQVSDLTVDLFNNAGGTMNRLERFLPQGQNAVRMVRAGREAWVQQHLTDLDWNRTRWPDGSVIPPEQRAEVLEGVFDTLTTDGANRIDVTAFRGRGRALGNQIDQHRFLHYRDADAWLRAHEAYGDGSIFDVMVQHIENMSHQIALVETFGPNPDIMANNINSIVRATAAEFGPEQVAAAEAVMNNKFRPIFETVSRQNVMDPHSTYGSLVTGTSNILTAAQLGSAAMLAIPGDFMQTAMVRALNGMSVFRGVDTYLKTLIADPLTSTGSQREIATQSGFVMDEVVMSTYAASRWTGVATVGPAATRAVSDAVMRASLLSGHTRAARWANQAEFMGLMQRSRDMAFEDLPFRDVMQRYGITPDEWNAMRENVQPWQPREGVNFMRPIDALQTTLPNRNELYRKFQAMIYEEGRRMVPESTVEGAVALRDTTRPDTLPGSLLYSFSMYKNFPISFMMIYGRLGMTSPTVRGRLGFYAALGAGMTMVGALGTQMREISKGRDPLPMDNAEFLGKAFLSGGAMSIWGDFLFAGVNEYGRGPAEVAAGPLVGFLGDTTNLVFGDVFQWAGSVGSLDPVGFESTTAARAVQWAQRYTPGSSIWWARKALEESVFNRLADLADPQASIKRARRVRSRQRDYGQGHWWLPGETLPERGPQFGE